MHYAVFLRCSASAAVLAVGTSLSAQAAAPSAAPPAVATPPGTGNGEIIVTGIRQSLASSQGLKRTAVQVVDAVVAEDIGKLPDLAVSDTAARIPGVQVYRQGGEAARVLVRGLPSFTTTYNGREIFTAETRVVALQDFPSANIAALEVFKTSTADLVEPGLAGLVNVRSRRPFDFRDGQVAGTAWGLYTRQAKKVTPNFNLLATKRWDVSGGEFGILINGSYTELQYLDSEPSNTDFIADPTINGTRVRLPDIQRVFYRSGNRVRPSLNGALQWKPTPDLEFYFDALWQGFRNKIDDRLIEAPLYAGSSYSNIVLRPSTNVVSSGTVVGAPNSIFTFQGGTYNKTDTFQFAGGVKYFAGPLKVTADLARTISTFTGSTESVDRRFAGTPTVTFNNEVPQFNITGLNPQSANAFLFQGLYEENQRSAGRDWQGRFDVQYDFEESFIKNFQVGVRYTDRNAIRQFGNRYAFLLPLNIDASRLPVTFASTPGGFVGSDIQPFRSFVSPTYDSIRSNLVQLRQFVISNCPAILTTDPGNGCRTYTTTPVTANLNYTAKEQTLAGYAQLNYAFGDNIDGAIGVRVRRIKTRVAGAAPTGIASIDNPRPYTDFLPNVSVRFKLDPQIQLRLSATRTKTRPDFVDLVPSITLGAPPPGGVGTESSPYPANGGNPFLRPFVSDNYDASLEYYFSQTGFTSLAVFHRSIDGFIQNSTFRFTDPKLGVVQVNGRSNAGKGRITGVEAQVQTFFDFPGLPDWSKAFGVQANLTYLDAKVQQPNPAGPGLVYDRISDPLIGTSKWNYNLVGLYESADFSGRLTFNGRSRFQAQRQLRGNDFYLEEAHPADRLDLSLNYNVLKAATVFFDWTNITSNPFRQSFSSARDGAPRAEYPRYLRYDEATVSLGVRFRFGG